MKVKLGDICDIKSGGTPLRSNNEYWNNGNIPWAKISDINNKYLYQTSENITELGLKNSSAKLFTKGTILYTIFATLGEVCILDIDATTNQAIAGITVLNNKIDKNYLYYYLISKKDYVNTIGRGVAQNNINLNILRNFSIDILPLEEQKKIANTLDKVTNLIELRKKQLEKLDIFSKALFIEMFGDPVENPMNWKKEKLISRCNIITGNTPSRKIKEYYGSYIEWIKSDNITKEFTIITTAKEYLSEEGFKVGRSIKKDNILMTCIAGSLKCIGNVAITDREVCFNQQINGIEILNDNYLFMYIQFILSQKYIQSSINMSLKGILSKSKLSELQFIFPPIELQNQFAKKVEHIDKIKLSIQDSLTKLETLKKSLMQEYFS